jgi:hypothetical protein
MQIYLCELAFCAGSETKRDFSVYIVLYSALVQINELIATLLFNVGFLISF